MKLLLLISLLLSASVHAQEINDRRALFNYQMFCQGCHTPDGAGAASVPPLKDQIGQFLKSRAGREYLVRVPGSATSALADAELAEVLNWIILQFSGSSADDGFVRYTASEVAHLRRDPLKEVVHYRQQLLAELEKTGA
ncbi:MAG: cytochrome c553 [Halioglobus sp.]|jgi:cytochrome c553